MIIHLVVALVILILDQVSKVLIVFVTNNNFPTLIVSYLGDFLQFRHDRNLGIAFSGLNNLDGLTRVIMLMVIPILFLGAVLWMYFFDKKMSKLQRWALVLIFSGGLGNIIDRVFRPEGVVDFISVKFFGLLGMARWPTFNIADSSLVIGGILIAISLITERKKAVT